MTDLAPEKRAELRMRAEAAKPFVGHDFVAPPFTTIDAADLLALLDAADERDWLQTVVGRLGRVNGEYAMEIRRCREALGVDEDTDPHHAAQALAAAVERVRALHVADSEGFCRACDYGTQHPCPTLHALDGTDE